MATAAAELFVRVAADVKGLTGGFDQAAKAAEKFGTTSHETATATKGLSSSLDGLKMAAGAIGLTAVIGGLAAVGKRSVDLAAELEQSKIAFTTMLGGAKQADTFLRDLASFAAQTPFELRGLTDASKKLLAFGFDAKAVIPIMTSVGNAVAAVGGGKETLDGVTLALGQIAAKGKVSAEEMNQLAERGIPAWKMLADGIGVSVPEAMKKAEAGAIDANTAIVALTNGMNQRFPDMMAKQSQTFSGAMSNLTDSVDLALTKIGTKFLETFRVTSVIQILSAAIGELTKAMGEGGLAGGLSAVIGRVNQFGATTKAVMIAVAAAVATVAVPAIVSMVPAIGGIVTAMASAASAAAPVLAVALAIGAAAYVIIRNWDTVRDAIWYAMDNAAKATEGFRNKAGRAFSATGEFILSVMRAINDAIRSVFGVDIAAKLGIGMGKLGGFFSSFRETAVSGLGVVRDAARYAMDDMAANFNLGFSQAAGAARMQVTKLTADMTGLGKTAAAATGKAAAGHHSAAAAAKKHAAEIKAAEAVNQKAFDRFEAMASALGGLSRGLAEVDRQAAAQGRSFDATGAKAKVYEGSIGALSSAFGKHSEQATSARAAFERFAAQSTNGGAQFAKAAKIIDDGTAALDLAREKARLTGAEWDETSKAYDNTREVLLRLYDEGLRPGNVLFDEVSVKLGNLKMATEAARGPFAGMLDVTGKVAASLSGLAGNAKTIADAFGAEFLNPVIDGVAKFGQFNSAVVGVINAFGDLKTNGLALFSFLSSTAIPTVISLGQSVLGVVIPAFKSFSAVLLANPIGLVAAGVGLLIIAGLALYENWDKVTAGLSVAWNAMKNAGLAAFNGLASGVSMIWDSITGVIRGSINGIVSIMNLLIRGMNRISINVPGWVPNIGGRSFGVNIPEVPYLATGGLVTDPTVARLGEGGRNEAVLPLNENVYRQIGQGIASARGGGGAGAQVVVQYYGSGKWTREDAQGLGKLLVSELRAMGVKA